MNPKIEKIIVEIEKAKTVIAEKQARIRDLEQQKTKLENAELIAAMRGMKATPDEFEAFLAARRGQNAAPEREASATPKPGYESNQPEVSDHEE